MKSKKYFHRKLVRDKIPEIIKARGGAFKAKVISESKTKYMLRRKLIEEAKEIVSAKKANLAEELADVIQIIKSIGELEKISLKGIIKKAAEKEKTSGAYKKGIYLIWSDKPQGFGSKLKNESSNL